MKNFFGFSRGCGNAVVAFLCMATMSANAAFVNDELSQKIDAATKNLRSPVLSWPSVANTQSPSGNAEAWLVQKPESHPDLQSSVLAVGLADFWASVDDGSIFDVSVRANELVDLIIDKRNPEIVKSI